MDTKILLNYSIIQEKVKQKEDEILASTSNTYLRNNLFEILTNVLSNDVLNIAKPLTNPEYIHSKYPIHTGNMRIYVDRISQDFKILCDCLNKFCNNVNLVVADANEIYGYRGVKFLAYDFMDDYKKARFSTSSMIKETFQNMEKDVLDTKFFVDRNLGFLCKKITGMYYLETTIEQITSSLRRVDGSYFRPDQDLTVEYLIKTNEDSIVNFLYVDLEFGGYQYIDEITHIKYSLDGVNYLDIPSDLLKLINNNIYSVYDQNYLAGFIPIYPSFMRYLKVGIKKKVASPEIGINNILMIRAQFSDEADMYELPIIYDFPYVSSSEIEANLFKPWDFNHYSGQLYLRESGSLIYKIELAKDTNKLKQLLNTNLPEADAKMLRNFSNYFSPILFGYTIYVRV